MSVETLLIAYLVGSIAYAFLCSIWVVQAKHLFNATRSKDLQNAIKNSVKKTAPGPIRSLLWPYHCLAHLVAAKKWHKTLL